MDKKINLQADELKKLSAYIQKHSGVDLDEKKLSRFKRKIEDVCSKHGFCDFLSFYNTIRFKKDEQISQDLINAITTNETYFWREHEQFQILTKEVLPALIQTGLSKIRILVSPSSSGEELYSIMFAILQEHRLIEQADYELIGIDIDSNMIAKAKYGKYTSRSVEKLPKDILEKYLIYKNGFYYIDKSFKEAATFVQINIFNENELKKLGQFDIVFSRNMLIYFDRDDKATAFSNFSKLLKPNGYLFLGHADANGIDKQHFIPFKSSSHVYKKSI